MSRAPRWPKQLEGQTTFCFLASSVSNDFITSMYIKVPTSSYAAWPYASVARDHDNPVDILRLCNQIALYIRSRDLYGPLAKQAREGTVPTRAGK
jgi:hypothetical protein